MEEFNTNSSNSPSWQWILPKLEDLVDSESRIQGSPWVHNSRLSKLFYKKYEVSLEYFAKENGLNLKKAIARSKKFSIYSTLDYHEFYVALFDSILPDFLPELPINKKIKYQIKRSWKVDGTLIQMLRSERYEEISHYPGKSEAEIKSENENTLKSKILSISEIESASDLEFYLINIVSILTNHNPKKFVTVSEISQCFCHYYGQPIRPVIRTVCPDLKLIEFLQVIPQLSVQNMENTWQITLSNFPKSILESEKVL